MPFDNNRGRDFPRGPQYKRLKYTQPQQLDCPVKRAKRRARITKELGNIGMRYGIGALFPTSVSVSAKAFQREYCLIAEAIALGMDVHPTLLEVYDLADEPNPSTRDFVELDDDIPF